MCVCVSFGNSYTCVNCLEAAEKEEIEKKKLEEQLRLKKLRKIVRKEKRKLRESEMHGPKEKPPKPEKKK